MLSMELSCPECNFKTHEDGAMYCPNCGMHLEVYEEKNVDDGERVYCILCGMQAPRSEARFCENCGNALVRKEDIAPKKHAAPKTKKPVYIDIAAKTPSQVAITYQPREKTPKPEVVVANQPPETYYVVHGAYFEKGQRYSGQVRLTNQEISLKSSKYQVDFVIEEIASASMGEKNNIFYIHLKDGNSYKFRLCLAKQYARKINELCNNH